MVGQQVGLNISEVLDPQFGGGGSVVGDLYFMIATAAFLFLDGHRQLVIGVYESLITCPPLSSFFTENIFHFILDALYSATKLALRISAPVFVTMLIVDISMGCISKTMPQLNVMSAGMAIRGMLGMLVLAIGAGAVGKAISSMLTAHLDKMTELFAPPM
jgi:flagellar biosynthetic protein FliR